MGIDRDRIAERCAAEGRAEPMEGILTADVLAAHIESVPELVDDLGSSTTG